ncbi:hypothetical protein Gogos_008604 [Gossypium gossypioides]|uniref:Wall-associated receptor kinase galacturonan-binding domain-containing protein n=1 Tax=Gossypium gossypioides TaxID=34282 RepID=A0A7J9CCE7_GOSGO|nr:hypothetical protein [Gossypium gossypioides]
MGLSFIFKKLALVAVTLTLTATSVAAQTQPGCESSCGNISIPYPFGTGDGCNISSNFFITCNTTFNPPKAFLTTSNIEILDISLDGYLRISNSIGYDCYNEVGLTSYSDMWLKLSKFPISYTRNKFTAIGCDTYAHVKDYLGDTYSTGCLTFCDNITNVMKGSCSGIGCCQTAIPKGVRSYQVTFGSSNNHSNVLSFNPCSYGFVVEDGAYNFSISDLYDENFRDKEFPMILDWTIGNQTCAEAKMDQENYACKENSDCIDPENGPGYLCKFSGYNCSCPDGFEGDGMRNGTGCSPKVVMPQHQSFSVAVVALGIGVGVLFSLVCLSWVYMGLRQRKLTAEKSENRQQNGGMLMREQLPKRAEMLTT